MSIIPLLIIVIFDSLNFVLQNFEFVTYYSYYSRLSSINIASFPGYSYVFNVKRGSGDEAIVIILSNKFKYLSL